MKISYGNGAFGAYMLITIALSGCSDINRTAPPSSDGLRRVASVVAEARQVTFEVTFETSSPSHPTRRVRFEVARTLASNGRWRSTIRPTPSATAPRNVDDIDELTVDENGRFAAVRQSGQQLPLELPNKYGRYTLDELDAAATRLTPSLERASETSGGRTASESRSVGASRLGWLDHVLVKALRRDEAANRLRLAYGAPERVANGVEHYRRAIGSRAVALSMDATSNVTSLEVSDGSHVLLRHTNEFIEAAGFAIRRRIVVERFDSAGSPLGTVTLTVSKIAIDGKEITP